VKGLSIVPLQEGHLHGVMEIEARSFNPPWSFQSMRRIARNPHIVAFAALLEQVVARFEAALAQGRGEEDFSAVARVYETALGRPFADGGAGEEA